MPWTDHPGPRPHRSQEELLDTVRQRAAAIRRRRARLSVALGGLAAIVVVSAALAGAGDQTPSQLQVVGGGPTSSTVVVTTAAAVETTTTATTAPVTTTVRPPAPTVVVTATNAPATTGRTAPPTTAAAPSPTAAPATTTTSTSAPPPLCDPADVVVTATTDRSTYARGEPVKVTASAQNKGSRPCMPENPGFAFFDQTGAGVGTIAVADAFTMPTPTDPHPVWAPGQVLSLTESWGQYCDPGTLGCPPGKYTVLVTFGPDFRAAPVPFTIT